MAGDEFLSYFNYDRMKLCSECYGVYGFWNYTHFAPSNWRTKETDIQYYQKCGCPSKPDMPPAEIEQKKWIGFDFNRAVTLCMCCGQEAISSGAKFASWHCEDCKKKAFQLNTHFQKTLIPYGGHSLMHGIGLTDFQDTNKRKEFWKDATGFLSQIDHIGKWTSLRISENFKTLGYHDDVLLNEYLSEAKKHLKKTEAFQRMCELLFGIKVKFRNVVY